MKSKFSASRPYSYDTARITLVNIVVDLQILAGEKVGPSDATWQDVAGTLAVNLRALAGSIEAAREGRVVDGPVVFPSLSEAIGGCDDE